MDRRSSQTRIQALAHFLDISNQVGHILERHPEARHSHVQLIPRRIKPHRNRAAEQSLVVSRVLASARCGDRIWPCERIPGEIRRRDAPLGLALSFASVAVRTRDCRGRDLRAAAAHDGGYLSTRETDSSKVNLPASLLLRGQLTISGGAKTAGRGQDHRGESHKRKATCETHVSDSLAGLSTDKGLPSIRRYFTPGLQHQELIVVGPQT